MSKIRFPAGDDEDDNGSGPWVAVSVAECLRRAADPRRPAVVRIVEAARAHTNRIGHAEFGAYELEELLGRDDPECPGARKLAGRSTIRKAVRDAVALGDLHPTSTIKCLVLPPDAVQAPRLGAARCITHRIGARNYVRT